MSGVCRYHSPTRRRATGSTRTTPANVVVVASGWREWAVRRVGETRCGARTSASVGSGSTASPATASAWYSRSSALLTSASVPAVASPCADSHTQRSDIFITAWAVCFLHEDDSSGQRPRERPAGGAAAWDGISGRETPPPTHPEFEGVELRSAPWARVQVKGAAPTPTEPLQESTAPASSRRRPARHRDGRVRVTPRTCWGGRHCSASCAACVATARRLSSPCATACALTCAREGTGRRRVSAANVRCVGPYTTHAARSMVKRRVWRRGARVVHTCSLMSTRKCHITHRAHLLSLCAAQGGDTHPPTH